MVLLRNYSRLSRNPEFLKEGTAVVDFLYPDRIVIGGDSERAVGIVRDIYEPLLDGSYYRRKGCIPGPVQYPERANLILTSTTSAELIKHASNAFLAMKISFINAVAAICESVGADVEEVALGLGSDSRMGTVFSSPELGTVARAFRKT